MRRLVILAIPLLFLAWLPLAQASEFSGRVTLASEYIYRGLAMSAGDPALQLGLDYAHDSGFFVGLWGSTIDLSTPVSQRDYELDYYAGYHHQFRAPLSVTASVLRYTYPGQEGAQDYDYTEYLLNATWFERLSLELGFTDDLYGHSTRSQHWEVQLDWPIASAWVVGATLGRNDMSDAGLPKYYYWDVGASARFSRLMVDLRWFDNEHPPAYAFPRTAGSRIVVSLSVPF